MKNKLYWPVLILIALLLVSCRQASPDSLVEDEIISFVVTMQIPSNGETQVSAEPPVNEPVLLPELSLELSNLQEIPAEVPPTEFIQTQQIIPVISETTAVPTIPVESPTETPVPYYQPQIINPNASGKGWKSLPVIPAEISRTARSIYEYGVSTLGRNGHYFSKIGDCQSMPNVFMGDFDYGTDMLQPQELYLEDAVNYFQGAFSAISYAVSNGMSAASLLTTTWSDPSVCARGESALLCELRINNPSLVFVNLGTNWIAGTDSQIYSDYMDEIVYTIIQHGTLPILSTKADNVEGDNSLNEITAAIARKYDVPFFNFWAAAQELENQGLDPARSNVYLTVDTWDIRSEWGLRMLYKVGHSLELF